MSYRRDVPAGSQQARSLEGRGWQGNSSLSAEEFPLVTRTGCGGEGPWAWAGGMSREVLKASVTGEEWPRSVYRRVPRNKGGPGPAGGLAPGKREGFCTWDEKVPGINSVELNGSFPLPSQGESRDSPRKDHIGCVILRDERKKWKQSFGGPAWGGGRKAGTLTMQQQPASTGPSRMGLEKGRAESSAGRTASRLLAGNKSNWPHGLAVTQVKSFYSVEMGALTGGSCRSAGDVTEAWAALLPHPRCSWAS